MRLPGGLTIERRNGVVVAGTKKQVDLFTRIPRPERGWFTMASEAFTGAWQRVIGPTGADPMNHPTWYACVTLIAENVAKIRPTLIELKSSGIWEETSSPAFSPVLRKPNHYQTRVQFYYAWVISKLAWGNAYVLKERDNRGVVTGLYLLDPTRVQPLVSPSGDVYYALSQDLLSGVEEPTVTVPAREIIHDRMVEMPGQPLVGLSPLVAAGLPIVQTMRLTQNSVTFAERGSQLGGMLLCPTPISSDTATRIEGDWAERVRGAGPGAVVAIGDGMKFEPLKMMSAIDSQFIEQLKWGDEKICSVLHVPMYLAVGGQAPPYTSPETLALQFYAQCLQFHFESLEEVLNYGLDLPEFYGVEFDTDNLMRMDTATRMTVATSGVNGAVFTPNEARALFSLQPVKGGENVYAQQQEWPLDQLSSRPPPGTVPAAPAQKQLPPAPAEPATKVDEDALWATAFSAKAAALGLTVKKNGMDSAVLERGGAGSGDFGHAGRPGEVGGSAPGGGGATQAVASRAAEIRAQATTDAERTYADQLAAADVENLQALAFGESVQVHTDPTTGQLTPERTAVHKEILHSLVENAPSHVTDGQQPVAVIMGGLPASGKTSSVGRDLVTANKVVINADDVKARLPEYNGQNATYLHTESSMIAEEALRVAMAQKKDLVLDATMRTAKSAESKIETLKQAGYRVEIRFSDIGINDSVERAVGRFVRAKAKEGVGRYVPVEYIKGQHDAKWGSLPRATFEKVKASADAYRLVDNRTRTPKIVEEKGTLTP